jgi:hypothetical protein
MVGYFMLRSAARKRGGRSRANRGPVRCDYVTPRWRERRQEDDPRHLSELLGVATDRLDVSVQLLAAFAGVDLDLDPD